MGWGNLRTELLAVVGDDEDEKCNKVQKQTNTHTLCGFQPPL